MDCYTNPVLHQPAYGYPVNQTQQNFPVAMAYVPWQKWQQTYPLCQGLQRGTIFPDLDLVFEKGWCK